MELRLQSEPDNPVVADHIEEASLPVTEHRPRPDNIDALRRLVMVIMVLDHARDYLGVSAMDPLWKLLAHVNNSVATDG